MLFITIETPISASGKIFPFNAFLFFMVSIYWHHIDIENRCGKVAIEKKKFMHSRGINYFFL